MIVLPDPHLLLSTCVPSGAVVDGLCNLVGGFAGWTQDVAEAVQNPFRWLYHHTLGAPVPQGPADPGWAACQADWSQPDCPKLIDQLKPDRIALSSSWPRLYSAFAVSGVVVAATCCVARVVRGVFDERQAGMHLVTDNVLRLIVAAGLLLSPSPDHSLLLNLMTWSAAASGRVATAAAGSITTALGSRGDLGATVGAVATLGFAHGGIGDFLVAIPILLAALGFVYISALYLLRVIQLVFAVATAPIFVAVAVFEPRNHAVRWWLDLLSSALLLPVLLGVFGSLTAAVALQFLGGADGAPSPGGEVGWVTRILLTCSAILGGVWMTGKAVHGLAWRGFSHGGITGAVTAVSTSIAALPNLAGAVGGAARATGRLAAPPGSSPRPGAAPPLAAALRGGGERSMSSAEATVAAAAAGLALAGSAHEEDGTGAAGSADFAGHPAAATLLREPHARDAFNSVVCTAVARYAATAEGRVSVTEATPELAAAPYSQRVVRYTELAAAHPTVGNGLAGAAVASLLHNQVPDVAPLLGTRAGLLSR